MMSCTGMESAIWTKRLSLLDRIARTIRHVSGHEHVQEIATLSNFYPNALEFHCHVWKNAIHSPKDPWDWWVYLPSCTIKSTIHVGKYSIHWVSGNKNLLWEQNWNNFGTQELIYKENIQKKSRRFVDDDFPYSPFLGLDLASWMSITIESNYCAIGIIYIYVVYFCKLCLIYSMNMYMFIHNQY